MGGEIKPTYYYLPVANGKKETLSFRTGDKLERTATYSYTGSYYDSSLAVRTAREMRKTDIAKNKGNITAAEANTIMRNLAKHIKGKDEINRFTPLFGLYTSPDSPGGTNITQQEQSEILRTLVEWESLDWNKK
ncbi:hypothetical protein IJ674_11240 [bacterium]|nr:hypothetical protein [bacterium]MBR1620445.1 hypothetical protein [bacterium]